jgi:hypothetical protein
MNIRWLSLRPVLKTLQGIERELRRMNDIREFELAHVHDLHVHPPQADTTGPEPEIVYTNEEADFYRELAEELGKASKLEA